MIPAEVQDTGLQFKHTVLLLTLAFPRFPCFLLHGVSFCVALGRSLNLLVPISAGKLGAGHGCVGKGNYFVFQSQAREKFPDCRAEDKNGHRRNLSITRVSLV